MKTNWSPLLHRLRYWQGQALRSRDLNDQMAFEDLLRAWHNRALHVAYGISEGLAVSLDVTANAVTVEPGLAFDARGRELIVGQPRTIPLPEGDIPPRGLILTLVYREKTTRCKTDLTGACLPGQAPVEQVVGFEWIRADRFDPRDAVPLARLEPGPTLAEAFNLPRSRPRAKPRIGYGATIPGNTAWRIWRREPESRLTRDTAREPVPVVEEEPDSGVVVVAESPRVATPDLPPPKVEVLGLEVEIDTSATGFTAVPCYLAWVEGDLWNPDLANLVANRFSSGRGESSEGTFWRLASCLALLQLLELRFGHVHQPTASGFTYRLWFPQIGKWRNTESLFEYLLLLAQQGQMTVAWVGVQEPVSLPSMSQNGLSLSSKECQ